MKNSESITLGTGELYVNNESVGYLAGDVTVTTEMESLSFEAGIPKSTIKQAVTRISRSIKATLAQIDLDTLKLAQPLGEKDGDMIKFGRKSTIDELTNVKFQHIRCDGAIVEVFFPKAQVTPETSELTFTESDWVGQEVTITALKDETQNDYPLGYIRIYNGQQGGQPGQSGTLVSDETVTFDTEHNYYKLAHGNVVLGSASVKSMDGNTEYAVDHDYNIQYDEGIITAAESSSIPCESGSQIKVSYSYNVQ